MVARPGCPSKYTHVLYLYVAERLETTVLSPVSVTHQVQVHCSTVVSVVNEGLDFVRN